VVMVAVETRERMATASAVRDMDKATPMRVTCGASCWRNASRQGRRAEALQHASRIAID
jgi:hypothetical protein